MSDVMHGHIDLIRREDVMDAILRINVWSVLTGGGIAWDKMLVAIYEAVENIPAVKYHPARADGKSMQYWKKAFENTSGIRTDEETEYRESLEEMKKLAMRQNIIEALKKGQKNE